MDFFLQLLEIIKETPQINSAMLEERMRQTQYWPHLQKLMAWNPTSDPGVSLEVEFKATLERLQANFHEQRIEQLLAKDRQESLNMDEKEELKQLLKR